MFHSHCLQCNIDGKVFSPTINGSLFCEGCQPVLLQSPEQYPMRHGFFHPFTGRRYGDGQCSYEAEAIYQSFGFTFDHGSKTYKFASPYEGVSVYFLLNNTLVKRVCLTDFFSETPKVVIRDYPF